MNGQIFFDWDSASEKAVKSHRKKLQDEMWRAGLSTNEMNFIRCLESDYGCWNPSVRTTLLDMANWCGSSERSMYRAKSELERLLIVHCTKYHDGFYIVVTWGNLDKLVALGRDEYERRLKEEQSSEYHESELHSLSKSSATQSKENDTVAKENDTVAKENDTLSIPSATQSGISATVAKSSDTVAETLYNSPYSPTPSTPKAQVEEVEGLSLIFQELESLGVNVPKPAVQKALKDGCSVEQLQTIIAHYKSHFGLNSAGKPIQAWGPGALQLRIATAYPGQAVDRGWDEPSDPWQLHHKAIQQQKRELDRKQQAAIEKQQADQLKQQKIAERESRYGPQLDAMCDQEVRQALNRTAFGKSILKLIGTNPDWRSRWRTGLLHALEEDQQQEEVT